MDSAHLDGLPVPDDSFLVVNEEVVETFEDTHASHTTSHPANIPRSAKVAFFDDSDYLNGALFEANNYCWSQTRSEIGKISEHH